MTMNRIHGLDVLLAGRRLLPRRSLVVLNYHRVLDHGTCFDDGVISATAAEFEAQMEIVARTGTSLSIADLTHVLTGKMPMPDNAVMVTFDDGYHDNYRTALPALLRHGVRATFFITTGFIETGRLPWWDRVSYILKNTHVGRLCLSYPTRINLNIQPGRERLIARRTLLRLIKQVFGLDHPRFFAHLEEAAEVKVDEPALARDLFMNWGQLLELVAAGMDIGSHTHSHRVLQTIDLTEAAHELALPRQIIRERLGIIPRAIAYPVGFPLSQTSGLRELVQGAGYEVGFTFIPGVIPAPADGVPVDSLNLPRLSVDRSDRAAGARFKAALLAPASVL
jgi:peptidoglycan/xylan/chitin deacetylase (PgdA/CDA1 family)